MTIPLSRFLVDFSEIAPPAGLVIALPEAVQASPDPLAAQIEDARRRASAEAKADHDRAMETMQADHAAHLTQTRREWVAQEGERIGAALTDQFKVLEEGLAGTLADLLEPLVVEATRLAALAEFRAVLTGLLANAGEGVVTVSGPADLTDAILSSYAGPARLVAQSADTADLTVQVGDTHIRTQFEAWTGRLRASLRAQS